MAGEKNKTKENTRMEDEDIEERLEVTADNILKSKRRDSEAWITVLEVLYKIAPEKPKSTTEIMRELLKYSNKISYKAPTKSILYILQTLEKNGFVKTLTPIGAERPRYWKLTDLGKRLTEKVMQLKEEIIT